MYLPFRLTALRRGDSGAYRQGGNLASGLPARLQHYTGSGRGSGDIMSKKGASPCSINSDLMAMTMCWSIFLSAEFSS
jgi:hypothetical protein